MKHKRDKLPNFTTWLRQQSERQDGVGVLARKVCNDPQWPRMQHLGSFEIYMTIFMADSSEGQGASQDKPYTGEDLHALYKAWEECVRATHGTRSWLSWKVSKMWDRCPMCRDVLITPQDYVRYKDTGTIVLVYHCHHCCQSWYYDWPMATFEQFNIQDVPVREYAK